MSNHEESLLRLWQLNEYELANEVRNTVLMQLSDVFVWLQQTPTIAQLKSELLISFKRAAAKLPDTASIKKTIEFYENI